MIFYGEDQEWLLRSLEDFQGSSYDRSMSRAIGARMDGGAVIVALNGYTGRDAELHIGATGQWCTRDYLRTMFTYLFNELGVDRLTARIESDNSRALNLARRLGFIDEGIQREAGRARRDLVCLGMLYRECRWIPDHLRLEVA